MDVVSAHSAGVQRRKRIGSGEVARARRHDRSGSVLGGRSGFRNAVGFSEAKDVRIGKAIELSIAAGSADEAKTRAKAMCDKLLANPVTEDYLVEVEGK